MMPDQKAIETAAKQSGRLSCVESRNGTAVKSTVTRERIAATGCLIRPHIGRTPVIETAGGEFALDIASLIFKLELLQHSGSFKVRGEFANLITQQAPPAGVVAASGGNQGAAVAYAAMKLGVP
jgi:threonine dehydratase